MFGMKLGFKASTRYAPASAPYVVKSLLSAPKSFTIPSRIGRALLANCPTVTTTQSVPSAIFAGSAVIASSSSSEYPRFPPATGSTAMKLSVRRRRCPR